MSTFSDAMSMHAHIMSPRAAAPTAAACRHGVALSVHEVAASPQTSVEPHIAPQFKMALRPARVEVEVKNRAGERVGNFDEDGFGKWRREIRKQLGGRQIGLAIGEQYIIDSLALLRALPPGRHEATLVQTSPIPCEARRELENCDLWKAI